MTECLVTRALTFSTAAHAAVGQKSKYTLEPYILHPIAVAEIVKSVAHSEAMLAAALLHDVIEDTAVDRDLVAEVFGDRVADLVWWLTDSSEGGNRGRSRADRQQARRRATYPRRTSRRAPRRHDRSAMGPSPPACRRLRG